MRVILRATGTTTQVIVEVCPIVIQGCARPLRMQIRMQGRMHDATSGEIRPSVQEQFKTLGRICAVFLVVGRRVVVIAWGLVKERIRGRQHRTRAIVLAQTGRYQHRAACRVQTPHLMHQAALPCNKGRMYLKALARAR